MKYDEIISLGSSCCPGLSLRNLKLKKETYPFDWVRNNSKIIYDVLLNGKDRYLSFDNEIISDDFYVKDLHSHTNPGFENSHINYYGQHFTHYININMNELKDKFNTYLDRLINLLNSNKKVLFIHSHEEYIYHYKSRDNKMELFRYLCKINDLLEEKYPSLIFEIINIDINNKFENYKNIINLDMEFNLPFSDKCEHHQFKYYNLYRNNITEIISSYLDNGIVLK